MQHYNFLNESELNNKLKLLYRRLGSNPPSNTLFLKILISTKVPTPSRKSINSASRVGKRETFEKHINFLKK